jgi:hypothetical protein
LKIIEKIKLLSYKVNDSSEEINKLKKSTEWNLVNNYKIRYFVLLHHKNEIPNIKDYFIYERERIRGGFLNYKNYLKSQNNFFKIKSNFGLYHIYFDSNESVDEEEIILANIHSDLKKFNLTYEEFSSSRSISMFLYILILRLK